MSNYNKLIGTVIGSVVGMGLVALGATETSMPQYQPFIDLVVAAVTASLGTYLAPKNSGA